MRAPMTTVEAAAAQFVRADRIARELVRLPGGSGPIVGRAQREREQARLALVLAVERR